MAQNGYTAELRSSVSRDFVHYHESAGDYTRRALASAKGGSRRSQSLDLLNESSPLLLPQQVIDDDDDTSTLRPGTPGLALDFADEEEEGTKSGWYLFLLALGIGGLQIAWSVEISNGSPYLLSLGMSKSLLAIVWIAGPLTGTLVQPYIGIRSDNCRISWGKRKPFMIGGTLITMVSLICLAWAREIVGGVLGLFGADTRSNGVRVTSIIFAVLVIYVLDIAVNTVQAAVRAFIVDNAPSHQQESANAWAGRIVGVGSIVGYLSGYVDLPKVTGGLFGNTQFKVLCVMASFVMGLTIAISSSYIRERDPRLEGSGEQASLGVLAFFSQLLTSMRRLNSQVRKVCGAQVFNWMGWFPFLFYITTYVGQLHVDPYFAKHPDLPKEEVDQEWEKATRVGTFALFIFALTSFASIMLLPFIIIPAHRPSSSMEQTPKSPMTPGFGIPTTPRTPGTGALSASITSYFPPPETHSRTTRLLSGLQVPHLTLRRAWIIAQLLFAFCMALTFFIRTPQAATWMVGLCGLSWALTCWAPFALISAEVAKSAEATRKGRDALATSEDQAGVILGIHNVAIAAPQILATLVCSLIFRAVQKPRGEAGDQSTAWVLRFVGATALVAAYMTSRIEEPVRERERSRKRGESSSESYQESV